MLLLTAYKEYVLEVFSTHDRSSSSTFTLSTPGISYPLIGFVFVLVFTAWLLVEIRLAFLSGFLTCTWLRLHQSQKEWTSRRATQHLSQSIFGLRIYMLEVFSNAFSPVSRKNWQSLPMFTTSWQVWSFLLSSINYLAGVLLLFELTWSHILSHFHISMHY